MNFRSVSFCATMVLLLVGLAIFPATLLAGEGWWNEGWQYRKKINFDTTETGAGIGENLSDVPVLVRLHSGNFSFTNAREDGETYGSWPRTT